MQQGFENSGDFPSETLISGYPGAVLGGFENHDLHAFLHGFAVNLHKNRLFVNEKRQGPMRPQNRKYPEAFLGLKCDRGAQNRGSYPENLFRDY